MNEFRSCASCGSPVRVNTCGCPHCGESSCRSASASKAALLLGLALTATGCIEEGSYQMDYGASYSDSGADADDDGYSVGEGDCDDTDAAVNPEATEIVGDEIDSNCNDDVDT